MTSAVHKASKMGEAAFRAAGGREIKPGLEFEYNGVKYRVVSPDLHGLRSYFSYEEADPNNIRAIMEALGYTPPPARPRPAPEMPGFKLIYAGPLEDLLAKAKMPPSEGQQIPPHILEILTALRPDPSPAPEPCGCGDNDGLQCSLPGCPYTTPSADSPKPEAEGCPCGCGSDDPDFNEVPVAEEPKAPKARVEYTEVGIDRKGAFTRITVRGVGAHHSGEDADAAISAIAGYYGVRDPVATIAHLEKENNRLHGLYEHYRADAKQARARAEKLENIIHCIFIDVQNAYKDAEIIPF